MSEILSADAIEHMRSAHFPIDETSRTGDFTQGDRETLCDSHEELRRENERLRASVDALRAMFHRAAGGRR